MKVGNQYIIPFKGLREGDHTFNFIIGKEFFEENLTLNISDGLLNADISLRRRSSFLELNVYMHGEVEMECDRCLENFKMPLEYSHLLYVKFKEELDEPDENVIYLHPSEDMLDLNQYFLDCVGLSIPIQKFHPEDENGEPSCDNEMLSILNAYSDKEDNNTEEDNSSIDPRWSKLKDLLNDGNKK